MDSFLEQDVERILCIPLSLQEHDDVVIWRGKPTENIQYGVGINSFYMMVLIIYK